MSSNTVEFNNKKKAKNIKIETPWCTVQYTQGKLSIIFFAQCKRYFEKRL